MLWVRRNFFQSIFFPFQVSQHAETPIWGKKDNIKKKTKTTSGNAYMNSEKKKAFFNNLCTKLLWYYSTVLKMPILL